MPASGRGRGPQVAVPSRRAGIVDRPERGSGSVIGASSVGGSGALIVGVNGGRGGVNAAAGVPLREVAPHRVRVRLGRFARARGADRRRRRNAVKARCSRRGCSCAGHGGKIGRVQASAVD